MTTARAALPHRRPSATVDAVWLGRPVIITVGFDDAGAPKEIFANGPKEGSDLAHLLADLCVVVSVALQHGVPPEALTKSLGRVPVWEGGDAPASIAGLLVAALAGEGG